MNNKRSATAESAMYKEGLKLTQIMRQNAQETISDEEVERVLKPIKELISAGHFDVRFRSTQQTRRWAVR